MHLMPTPPSGSLCSNLVCGGSQCEPPQTRFDQINDRPPSSHMLAIPSGPYSMALVALSIILADAGHLEEHLSNGLN